MKTHPLQRHSAVKQVMSVVDRFSEQKNPWESFVGLWERSSLIRSFLWSQEFTDERALLTQFLARIRRFFAVEFCFAALFYEGERNLEVGLPEPGLYRLPVNFSRRCLDLVANSRVPIAWKQQIQSESGFRSTVVSPLSPAVGQPLGLIVLGHSTPRSFTSSELFLLQSLAGELSWALRVLRLKKSHQRILAAVSHELKNPLNLVIGHSNLLRESLAETLTQEDKDQFRNIDAGAEEILSLVNGFLDLPVANEGSMVVVEDSVNLVDVVEEVVAPLREQAQRKGIGLEIYYVPGLPSEIVTDAVKFKQILRNLVGNAIKFTPVGCVKVKVQRKDPMLEFVVRDTGIGIAPENLRMIFESVSEENFSGNQTRAGAGLGLSLTKQFLDLLKGHVHVRSWPGKGSEFTVCLPCD